MAWTDIGDFTTYVGSEIVADLDILQNALTAAENGVRHHCGRDFTQVDGSADSSTRYYRPNRDLVTIHDIADSTGLSITDNGATIASSGYQLEPANQLAMDGSYRPYDTIRRMYGWWQAQLGGPEELTIAVSTARWGWTTVPDAVVEATFILAKDLAHLRSNRFGVAGFGDFGVVRVRDNPHVTQILQPFRKQRTAIGIA